MSRRWYRSGIYVLYTNGCGRKTTHACQKWEGNILDINLEAVEFLCNEMQYEN